MKVLLFLILSFAALAEYRVYQYFVRSAFPANQDKFEYIITSSLDPVSYISYHGGSENIQVELARTWICPGHTGNFKAYCNGPYEQNAITAKVE